MRVVWMYVLINAWLTALYQHLRLSFQNCALINVFGVSQRVLIKACIEHYIKEANVLSESVRFVIYMHERHQNSTLWDFRYHNLLTGMLFILLNGKISPKTISTVAMIPYIYVLDTKSAYDDKGLMPAGNKPLSEPILNVNTRTMPSSWLRTFQVIVVAHDDVIK